MYYDIIKSHYGQNKAKRSGKLYIRHIDEGLMILEALNAAQETKDAFCVHPILQIPETLLSSDVTGWNPKVVLLAMEYRNKANAYSSHMGNKPPKMILPEVVEMLVADKLQNFKDFANHIDKYEDRERLQTYFTKWLVHLGYESFVPFILEGTTIDKIVTKLKE